MSEAGDKLGAIIADASKGSPLVHIEPDTCCANRLRKALPKMAPDCLLWECLKCGCTWRRSMSGDVQVWAPEQWAVAL
jgi:hypothetical protein